MTLTCDIAEWSLMRSLGCAAGGWLSEASRIQKPTRR
jgi:hypothetical protein